MLVCRGRTPLCLMKIHLQLLKTFVNRSCEWFDSDMYYCSYRQVSHTSRIFFKSCSSDRLRPLWWDQCLWVQWGDVVPGVDGSTSLLWLTVLSDCEQHESPGVCSFPAQPTAFILRNKGTKITDVDEGKRSHFPVYLSSHGVTVLHHICWEYSHCDPQMSV